MPVNDYLPFATSPGATVLSQPNYLGLTARGTGFQQGIADEYSFNKAMRQASMSAAVLAQFTVDNSGQDLFDDGNIASWEAKLSKAIANNTSNVLFGSGGFRIRLTANKSLYVNGTTGNDANNGTSPITALATPQAAWNLIITSYDLNDKNVTVNIADGAYSSLLCAGLPPGFGTDSQILFLGNTSTPTAVTFTGSNQNACTAIFNAQIALSGISFRSSGVIGAAATPSSNIVVAVSSGVILTGPCNFAACPGSHIWVQSGGIFFATNINYTISAGATTHLLSGSAGNVVIFGGTQTLTGTPNFTNAFAYSYGIGYLQVYGNTYVGAATGPRYFASNSGVIVTNGGGPNWFPGSVAGIANPANGGYYS